MKKLDSANPACCFCLPLCMFWRRSMTLVTKAWVLWQLEIFKKACVLTNGQHIFRFPACTAAASITVR